MKWKCSNIPAMPDAFDWIAFMSRPIVGILRGFDRRQTIQSALAAMEGGLRTIEVTMNTDDAADLIAELREEVGNRMTVGAGTVCNADDLQSALQAAAQFIVTPVVALDVLAGCKQRDIVVFVGAMSPTEVYHAHTAGASLVKIFPSEHLGPAYISSLKRPLNKVKLMPTGGVNAQTIAAFHAAGADAYGVGSCLFDKNRIAAGDWKWITAQTHDLVDAYDRAAGRA
jgi:2-dehydro-3-deoxyphosphogluconate aldolase / (4S)-4-hydroxy-2-oxoglutarate aldolase